jgi:hypothetical protein
MKSAQPNLQKPMKTAKLFKTLFVSGLAAFAVACAPKYDDTAVWDSINSLEARMDAMETVMDAYENNLFIKTVVQNDDGYTITFSDGSTAIIAHGNEGAQGAKGDKGEPGEPGTAGDTLIESIVVGATDVTFTLTNGDTFTIPIGSPLSIEFEVEDLVAMATYGTRDIHYTVTSSAQTVKVEALFSSDLYGTVTPDDASGKTGAIEVNTSYYIDKYSRMVVLVSDGDKVIMRGFSFEEAAIAIDDNATKSVTAAGGEVTLEFLSNVEYDVVIPTAAQSWISVVAPAQTRAMESHTVTLKVAANTGAARSAKVTVGNAAEYAVVEYTISQAAGGDAPEPEPGTIQEGTYEITYTSLYDGVEYSFNMDLTKYDDTYYQFSGDWFGLGLTNPVLLGEADMSAKTISFDGSDLYSGTVYHDGFGQIYYTMNSGAYYLAFFGSGDSGTDPIVMTFGDDGYMTTVSAFSWEVFDAATMDYLGGYEAVDGTATMSYVGASAAAAKAAATPRKPSGVTFVGKQVGIGVLAR